LKKSEFSFSFHFRRGQRFFIESVCQYPRAGKGTFRLGREEMTGLFKAGFNVLGHFEKI
jgi:hypothetical protein